MHDLRQTLYSHDAAPVARPITTRTQTGDLISRVTSDIDAIQSFIASALLGALIRCPDAGGHDRGDVLHELALHPDRALGSAAASAIVVYRYTRRIKTAAREVRKKEGEMVSVIQEVLTSIRVVKAFAREDYEQHRLEEESLESVEIALRARGLKARLSPIVEMIVAVGTCLVLWFGARMVLAGSSQPDR